MLTPDSEGEKCRAAEATALLVEESMTIGVGTGTTVATGRKAARLGLRVKTFSTDRSDMVIDGAGQITSDGWLTKEGGGAHARENLVAAAAQVFVVIAAERAGAHVPRAGATRVSRNRCRCDALPYRHRPST
jgi:ribose 5-phosphate isomerase A